jgi:DeoR family fructose operon transcriptional repressor
MVYGETDVAARNLINVEEKEKIARYAAALISDYDFVFLDAGTTTEKMIDYLEKRNVTYVTNGISHAKKLIQRGFDAHVIGGLLRPATEAVVGETAIDTIRKYNFTKCFMGATGVDFEKGLTTRDISEAAVKSAAIKQSQKTFVLADHAKFGKVSSVSFAGLDAVCIITDRLDDPKLEERAVITIVK